VPCLITSRHVPKYVSAHSIAQKKPNDYAIFSDNVTIIYIRILNSYVTSTQSEHLRFLALDKNSANRAEIATFINEQFGSCSESIYIKQPNVRPSVYPPHPASHKRRVVEKKGANTRDVGFEVFTAVVLKSIIFWDMTPCSP
jgi:hypothetical protein